MTSFRYIMLLLVIILPFSLNTHANNPLRVVTSIPPLNAIAAGILGDVTTPDLLVPAEASHHHYALKPSDRQALQHANVVIWIGNNLEFFLQKPILQLPKETQIITIEELTDLKRYPIRANKTWEPNYEDHHHEAGIDPHLWLDPNNAILIIQHLTQSFSDLDAKKCPHLSKECAKHD